MKERASNRGKYWALAGAALLALLAVFMPAQWLDRALVEVPTSPLPPESAVTFVRAALGLNAALLFLWGLTRRPVLEGGPDVQGAKGSEEPPLLRLELVILGVVLTLAAALRLWKLGTDLWFDEVMDLVYYVRGPVEDLLLRFPGFFPQVTSALAAKLSMAVLGETEFAFRLPAALAGVAGVGAMFFLGRKVLGRWGGAWCALLLAVAYHHVFFSQNARGYSIQVLLTIVATYYLFRAVETNSARAWFFYGAASVLNLYTQVFALFAGAGLAAAYAGHLLWSRRSAGKTAERWAPFVWTHVWIGSVTFLLYSPMMVGLLVSAGITAPSTIAGAKISGGLLHELLQGLQAGYGSVAIVGGAAVFLVGAVSLWRRNAFHAAALLLPVIIGMAAVFAGGIGAHPRYFIYAMPAGLLVVVGGLEVWSEWGAKLLRLPQQGRAVHGACTAMVLVGVLISVWKLGPYYAVPKQDFTGALRFARQSRQPEEPLVASGQAAHVYSIYYAPGIRIVNSVEELERLRAEGRRVWLLYTLAYVLRHENPDLLQYIDQNFEVVRRFPGSVYQGSLYVCRAEPLELGVQAPPVEAEQR